MSSEFTPVAKSTLSDEVAHRVTQLIRSGSYTTGDRLPTISDMADRFDVGPPTLREALKKLEALGVVHIKHGSGVYVQKHQDVLLISNPIFAGKASKKIMLDLIEARLSIEPTSVRRAAEHATEENLKRMKTLLADAGEHLGDDAALNQANMSFHREVAAASGNEVIKQMLDVLADLFKDEQRVILNVYGLRSKDHQEHLGILEALQAHNPDQAEQRMRDHLEGVRDVLRQWDPQEHPLQ